LYSLQKRMPAVNKLGITSSTSAQSYHKHMGLVESETGKFQEILSFKIPVFYLEDIDLRV